RTAARAAKPWRDKREDRQSLRDARMLDLLDVFVEADRLVDFTRFFTHSGTREVRSREALRPLLILDLFGEATNMGIKQVANATPLVSQKF
ncbi:MAG: hypothetical protein QOI53_3462, partial [Verrucomicrobiota bacterium]|nr:hypothetical protein [Verrucomicrobiota bacterium]